MKTAFVHDWIVHEWWAEAVLRTLIQETDYTQATLFTLYSTKKEFFIERKPSRHNAIWDTTEDLYSTNIYTIKIITALPVCINSIFSFFHANKVPVLSTLFDYRNLMFWFPVLCRLLKYKIKRYKPDSIVIDSFAAVKNIVEVRDDSNISGGSKNDTYIWSTWNDNEDTDNSVNNTIHKEYRQNRQSHTTLYLHSPMQYIRENYEENVNKLKFPIKQFYKFATTYLRPWDKKSRKYDVVLCNSNYTAELAKQLYNIDGQVAYPQIDKAFFAEPVVDITKPYYMFVGRVQRYVREIDKVIMLCNKTQTPLIVMGDGPDMDYAKSIAGPTIIFVGSITDVDEKIALMKHASGLINIAKESFGITTAEALCLGVPVFGYNGGATPELVNSSNGYLVADKEMETLISGFATYKEILFDKEKIAWDARATFQTNHCSKHPN